jgi:hypothetical protein
MMRQSDAGSELVSAAAAVGHCRTLVFVPRKACWTLLLFQSYEEDDLQRKKEDRISCRPRSVLFRRDLAFALSSH